MDERYNDWLFDVSSGLLHIFGTAIVERALELAKGCSPEANIMPYIYKALEEARASDSAVANRDTSVD